MLFRYQQPKIPPPAILKLVSNFPCATQNALGQLLVIGVESLMSVTERETTESPIVKTTTITKRTNQ